MLGKTVLKWFQKTLQKRFLGPSLCLSEMLPA